MPQSELEATFIYYWRVLNGPPLLPEYRFHPKRKFRLDFVHLPTMIAIEIEGGIWTGGRHTSGKGYTNDCIKYNLATLAGWHIFRLTGDMLNEPDKYIKPIIKFTGAIEQ